VALGLLHFAFLAALRPEKSAGNSIRRAAVAPGALARPRCLTIDIGSTLSAPVAA
jgi:hypothetical protein